MKLFILILSSFFIISSPVLAKSKKANTDISGQWTALFFPFRLTPKARLIASLHSRENANIYPRFCEKH